MESSWNRNIYKRNGCRLMSQELDPIVALLTRYKEMPEDSIIEHINDWWFDINGQKAFNEAVSNNTIIQNPQTKLWKLNGID